MKATYFIISGDVNDSNLNIFVNAIKNGHQLANHGKTNSVHFLKSQTKLKDEIMHCDKLIKDIYKIANIDLPQVMYYRPGCGVFNTKMIQLLSQLNYKLALGSTYPNDATITSSLINYFYLKNHIEAGDIIILHDRKSTPDLLEKLLPWLILKNLQSVTLTTLFN